LIERDGVRDNDDMPCKIASAYRSSHWSCAIGMRNIWKEKLGLVKYDILKESHVVTADAEYPNCAKRAVTVAD
jgi:hypothetical protein